MSKLKYMIAFTSHDAQGDYRGYVTKVFFNELSGRKQINGRLRSDNAKLYASEKAAQKVVDEIKAHESDYDSFWPIDDIFVMREI